MRVRRADLDFERERLAGALHVTNGDVTGDLLGETGLARHVLPWRDVLHEGPVPAGTDEAELRRIRARFLAGEDTGGVEGILAGLVARDRTLEGACGGEYVLWFEADLYDQLQIVQVLARLASLGVAPERIILVCVGEYPGVDRFAGLGQLGPGQLAGLLLTAAVPLTAAALNLATAAWSALRAGEPGELGEIAAARSAELRFLGEAFDRLSREYPSSRDGLSLTERRILAAAATASAPTAGAVFARASAREPRPFLGDVFCFRLIARLARAPVPLLETDPAGVPVTANTRLRPTAAGGEVLRGDADFVDLNGIDRWIGGVHLQGDRSPWRWDEGTESIIPG